MHFPAGKSKAELDKAMEFGRRGDDYDTARQRIARLELENERLRQDLELAQAKTTRFGSNIYSSTHELDRIHERADKTSSDLRRCQAELRVTQADSERARSEAQALQEKLEKSQVRLVVIMGNAAESGYLALQNSYNLGAAPTQHTSP